MVSVRLHQLYIEQTWLTTPMVTEITLYENRTELAKYIWQLKRDNISFSVKWTIITKVYGSPNPLLSKLCLTEKLWIINFINDGNMLNKRLELLSRCRHLWNVMECYGK